MDTEKDFSKFSKTIKIYDDLDSDPDNIIKILESSNMHLGTGSRIWECVKKTITFIYISSIFNNI